MRIIVACSQYPPARSGYAQVAGHLVEGFRRANHQVTVITEGAGCRRVARVAVLDEIGRKVLRGGAEIVQVIGPTPIFTEQVAIEASRLGLPVVYYIHAFAGLGTYRQGFFFKLGDSLYLRTYYRRALRRVGHATSSTRDFAGSCRFYSGPWTIIPNGVSDPCLESGVLPPLPEESRPHTELRVLFVGQLRPYKAVHVLLRAVAELLREGRKLRLTIVGDGPERPRLEHLVDVFGIRQSVVLKGLLADDALHTEYLTNDLLVLPSVQGESFGIVLLEARLHGLQLLASDLPGVREVVRNVGGAVVPPGDPRGIAEALRGARPLEPAARVFDDRVAATYSWKNIAASYLELYRSILAR